MEFRSIRTKNTFRCLRRGQVKVIWIADTRKNLDEWNFKIFLINVGLIGIYLKIFVYVAKVEV